ncbi:MAG: sialidase family protein, partial [bacterium]
GDGDVYYMVSYDNGVTWDSGVEIAGSSTDYAPAALAVNGSTVHVVWVEYDGSDYYIWYQNSTDNGGSWGSTQRLIGPVVMADDPSITCNSTFVSFIWEDGRDDGQFSNEIYIKNSTNSGGTWGVNTRLTDQSGDVDGPRITMTEGKKYVVWWDDRHGNEEIYFKCSPDFTSVPEFPNLLMPVLAVPAIIFLYERIRKTSKN